MGAVWVTRSQPGADESADKLRALGYTPIVAPVIAIGSPDTPPPSPPEKAVLIFTSKNGVNAYCQMFENRESTVVCVGDATARLAREAGFSDVRSARGAADDVKRLIFRTFPKVLSFVHCAGNLTRGNIVEDLQAAGYTARRDIYYRSYAAHPHPEINLDQVTGILVYSPFAAQILADFDLPLENKRIICISEAAAKPFKMCAGASVFIANHPSEAEMFVALCA